MSTFQIVVLAIFAALAVAGVGIFAFVVGGQQTSTIGQVEVWGTFDDAAFNAVLRQLSEGDSRFKNITYVEKKPETYSSDLTEALASGRGPDIFLMRQDSAVRDASKVLPIPYESFPREQFANTFIQSAEPFLSSSGVLAIPLLVDPLVLYWNRDMLGTAGFSQAPQAWDELYNYSAKLTKRDETNSVLKSGVALGEYQNVAHAKDILALLILQAGGRITVQQGDTLVSALLSRSNEAQLPVEAALRFYTEFANPSNVYYSWNRAQRESRAAFGASLLALYVGRASEEVFIRQTNPNLNFAAAAIPQLKTKDTAINVGDVYALAIPRTSDNLGGAQQAAYILASSQSSSLLAQAIGVPSARRDVLAQSVECHECLRAGSGCAEDKRKQCVGFDTSGTDYLFNKQAIISRSWIDPNPEKTDELFRGMIEGVTSGAQKISEALQRADQTLGTLLREQE